MQLFADERNQPDAQHDADGHNQKHIDILLGSQCGAGTQALPHNAEGVVGCDSLIAHRADNAQPQPRQWKSQLFAECDHTDNDGNRRRDGKDGGGCDGFTDLFLIHTKFFAAAQKEPWFDNTIFVLLGDHGKLVGTPECEIPHSYNHVPLMIYGKGIAPERIEGFGGQIDVAPTLLGMLGMEYVQNNFGVDMLKEQRPCIFYTADNLIAARDSSHLYVFSPETGQEFLYEYTGGKISTAQYSDVYGRLKEYCFSMLQSTEYLVRQGAIVDRPKMAGEQ